MIKKLTITILLSLILTSAAFTQTTDFTYQGRLIDGIVAQTGNYDFEFDLYDAATGGTQIGVTAQRLNVAVDNGIFTVQLSFAGQFPGADRFLEIRVRNAGGGAYETLTPRQPVTSAPYAIKSLNADTATNATNFSGSLSGDVTGTQSSTTVASVGGVTAPNVASGATLANNATDAQTANAIVRRDFAGNFSAGSISAGRINLPVTSSSTVGVISQDGGPIMHTSGMSNFFAASAAGNFLLTGTRNTGVGFNSLTAITTGSSNSGFGFFALDSTTEGTANTAVGDNSLQNNVTGNDNTAIGFASLPSATGSGNIGIGVFAGNSLTTGNNNIMIGNQGDAADSNTIRIGSSAQNRTFIAGINGATSSGGTAVFVNSDGQLGTVTSSRRFKYNIFDMKDSSESIFKLRPVNFLYKKEIDGNGIPQWGLIAEEVEKINPDLVIRNADGTIQTVRYEQINAMLLNEFLKEHERVKGLTEENKEMKLRLTELEKQAEDREARLEKLEKLLLPKN